MRDKSPKVVTFNLLGGVGNQLFIYFAGQFFQELTGKKVLYEQVRLSKSDSIHNSNLKDLDIEIPIRTSFYARQPIGKVLYLTRKYYALFPTLSRSVYLSEKSGFDPDLNLSLNANRVHGYFQSHKYFSALKSKNNFELFPRNPSKIFLLELKLIDEVRPISIHIRRGDYYKNPKFGILSKYYYKNAIEIAQNILGSSQIWVFSDDLDSAATILDFIPAKQLKFVSKSLSDSEALVLMSRSAGLIIANSTFSFWGALVGNPSKLVIAPDKWFKALEDPEHLYPESWLSCVSDWEDVGNNP